MRREKVCACAWWTKAGKSADGRMVWAGQGLPGKVDPQLCTLLVTTIASDLCMIPGPTSRPREDLAAVSTNILSSDKETDKSVP